VFPQFSEIGGSGPKRWTPPETHLGPEGAKGTRRILVAEDDDGFRAALAMSLRMAGYVVTETHDGRELLDALNATPSGFFDLVIADHWMPRVHGIEALAQAGRRAPFVILSGAEDPVIHASAEKFGAAAVVKKPVELPDLLDIVRGLLAAS
jgi:CheY-like chemotaxis protein